MDLATIHAAQYGDRPAQARLLHALQDAWYRLALAMLGDVEKARDATQETALRFLRHLPSFRGDSQLRTWSLGIAINVARELKRSSRPFVTLDEWGLPAERNERNTPRPPPDVAAELAEQRDRLRAVLDDLPERQREAIVLRFLEELSVEDTAAAMDCAPGTVKATVHQALRAMRKRFKVFV